MLRLRLALIGGLVLAAVPAGAQRRVTDSTATGSAALEGVVRDSAGKPVARALVSVALPARAVLTDSLGRFALTDLPSDTIDVAVQDSGYAPARFALAIPDGITVSIAVKLLPARELAPVIVSSQRRDLALTRRGFYERARIGMGKTYGPDDLARRSAERLSVFAREVPSMRVSCSATSGRDCIIKDAAGCAVPLWVDGVPKNEVDDYDQVLRFADVKAIEVYRRASEVPPEFSTAGRSRGCGALVVWTRFAR